MTVLGGRYRVDREVGRGAMGVVYLAYDERLDRRVALKELLLYGHLTPELRHELAGRFDREARAAARLNHPNIVSVYDVFVDDERSYIVMEYVEGETLDALLARGTLDPESAAAIAVQILNAIDHAHANAVIHRDLKPENVFVQPSGSVKVADFGIAHIGDASASWTRAGTIVGTVGYMSPEQLRGEAVDQRTDVFAVGVLLYEMLTGINPFGADSQTAVMYRIAHEEPPPLRTMRTGAPKYLDAVIRKALHKEREQRYQSASEMAFDILHRKSPKVRPATLRPPPVVAPVPAQAGAPVADTGKAAPTVIGVPAAEARPGLSAPTVIGAAGTTSDPRVEALLPASAPDAASPRVESLPGATDAPLAEWLAGEAADSPAGSEEAASRTGSWIRVGSLAAIIAVVVIGTVVAGVALFPSGGDTVGPSDTVAGITVEDARSLSSLQKTLATTAATYSQAVAEVGEAKTPGVDRVEAWKRRYDKYLKRMANRQAVLNENKNERARATPATTEIYWTTDPYTGRPIPHSRLVGGYTPQLKTVPSMPSKPKAPRVTLQPALKQLRAVSRQLRRLQEAISATSAGPAARSLLEQTEALRGDVETATSAVRVAIEDAGVTKGKYKQRQTYTYVKSPDKLKGLDDGADFKSRAIELRKELLALMKSGGLPAASLNPKWTSPTPSAGAVVGSPSGEPIVVSPSALATP